MIESVAATIPGGCWVNGAWRREARLRPLTGADQASLVEEGRSLAPAEWATEVLARCVTGLATGEPVTRDVVRSMTVGDREALLLQLRRLTAGERIACRLACPSPECGEQLDLDLNVADLLLPPYDALPERHEMSLHEGEADYRVRFRLPTGGDQEAAAPLARTDLQAAAALLLRRCVESVVRGDGEAVDTLPAALVDELATAMSDLDAQAELTLRVTCPACGRAFPAIFDAASYLYQELSADTRQLHREVHLLAFHYHWSPSEILGMTPRTRRRYLETLEDALARSAGQ